MASTNVSADSQQPETVSLKSILMEAANADAPPLPKPEDGRNNESIAPKGVPKSGLEQGFYKVCFNLFAENLLNYLILSININQMQVELPTKSASVS